MIPLIDIALKDLLAYKIGDKTPIFSYCPRILMSENKIVYITPEAENKAKWIAREKKLKVEIKETDALINSVIDRFLKDEPIDDILVKINEGYEKFNNWVYDNDPIFFDSEYTWLISEEDIFVPDEDIFEYYDKEKLDLNTNEQILEFMHSKIDEKCEDLVAYHYELYKGVYISSSCEMMGQGGPFFSDFCIYKTEDEFWDFCKGSIINSSEWGIKTSDAELISMFKKNITDKYFQ